MIEKRSKVQINGITKHGQINIEEFDEFWEGDELVGTSPKTHSRVIEPDTDYEGDDQELINVIAAIHTSEKKEKFKALRVKWDKETSEIMKTKVKAARAENAARGKPE